MQFLTSGDRIKRLRKQLNMKQHELQEANITRNFISMVERNKRNLSRETAENLAELFNRKALQKGISLKISAEDLLATPIEEAERYCLNKLESSCSLTDLNNVIDIGQKFHLQSILLQAYRLKGNLLYDDKNFTEAILYYYNALEIALTINNNEYKAWLSNRLGMCKIECLDYIEALDHLKKAYQYAVLYKDDMTQRNALFNQALVLKKLGEFKKAIKILDEFLSIYDLKNHFAGYMNAMIVKGNCYIEIEDINNAISVFENLLAILNPSQNSLLGYVYNNLGVLYTKLQDMDNALTYFKQAYLLRIEHDKYNVSHTLIDQSDVYIKQDKFPEAISLIEEGLALAETYNDYEYLLKGYSLLEDIYNKTNQRIQLKEIYEHMLHILSPKKDKEQLMKTYIKLALLSLEEGDVENAKQHLIQSIHEPKT